MKTFSIALITLFLSQSLWAQDRVKVMVYNLLNYGNVTSYCTVSNNSMSAKNTYNAQIFDYVKPDILGVVEIGSSDFAHQRLLDSALNVNGVSKFAKASAKNLAGSSIMSLLYYNTEKFGLAGVVSLQHQVRDIVLFRLYYKSPKLATTQDTAFVNCIVAHLKSSNTSANRTIRDQMVTAAMSYLSSNYPSDNYLFMGDFNVYSSTESAYQTLLNYSQASYRFYDPINRPGSWNNSSSYADVHTQSTHSSSNGCAAGGGLDDRFDFILMSNDLKNGSKHISYVPNSYKAIGNDGNHFNQSINNGSNTSVPPLILNALYNNSDHLPVVLELDLDNTISGISDAGEAQKVKVRFENPVKQTLELYISSETPQNLETRIYDIQGRELKRSLDFISNNTRVVFNLNSMAEGLYVVQILNEDGQVIYNTKVLKP